MRKHNRCQRLRLARNIGALLIASSLLSGCNLIKKPLNDLPMKRSKAHACKTAPVLMTNLNAHSHPRRYRLPNGPACLMRMN